MLRPKQQFLMEVIRGVLTVKGKQNIYVGGNNTLDRKVFLWEGVEGGITPPPSLYYRAPGDSPETENNFNGTNFNHEYDTFNDPRHICFILYHVFSKLGSFYRTLVYTCT